MNRRSVLASSGVVFSVLAGCINSNDETDSTNGNSSEDDSSNSVDTDCDTPDVSEADNGPGEEFPAIELLADESGRDDIAIATRVVRHFDAAGPAKIRIAVTNDSDERRQFTFLDHAPFPAYTGFQSDGEAGLIIAPESGYQIDTPDEPVDGCWRIDDPPAVSDVEATVDMEPCETVAETYELYHVSGEDCFAEGEYRFEVADVGEAGHEWGFTVLVAYP